MVVCQNLRFALCVFITEYLSSYLHLLSSKQNTSGRFNPASFKPLGCTSWLHVVAFSFLADNKWRLHLKREKIVYLKKKAVV